MAELIQTGAILDIAIAAFFIWVFWKEFKMLFNLTSERNPFPLGKG